MENQNTKKVLSECSNTQCNLYLGCGNSINSMKKMDYLITRGSSDAPAANIISESLNSVGSTLINHQSSTMNDTSDWTTARRKSEVKTNVEIANSQVIPSRDFSDCTAADYGITPEFFTKQCKEESKNILKKLRRRSAIGARGSPENESLIRYIAQQRRMRMQETVLQSSPFQHRNTLLKDKIAAFQSSFKPLEETEEKALHIQTASNTRLHEQSKLSQVWSLEDKSNAFEENLNNKFMNGDDISADIQMHSTRFPSWEPFLSGTNVVSKAILLSPANAVESTSVSLVASPSMGISKSECGAQSTNKELSRNGTSQDSRKKVRFSEKQSLEIFDESKPPITPVDKGHLFSNSLRSVLKKAPVKISPEGLKDLQGSSEEVATPIFPGTSYLKETKNNSPDHQAPLIRTTRTSAKRKCVAKAEEKNLATKTEAKNQPGKFQKAKTSTKPKKAPASQQGKKRKGKKKEQKALYGQRETVSKKPLLSPILEATEDASFFSSYPNTPTLEASTSDDSLSDLPAKFINEIAEDKKSPLHAIKEDSHCQHSSLDLREEDSIPSSFLQLQDLTLNNRKQLLPGYLPEKNPPGKLKSSLNGNEQVVGSDCLSSGAEVQLAELLNMCGTSKNIKAKGASFFTVDFEAELMSESNQVNFERIPRNSRRLTGDFLNTEDLQSQSPGNGAGVPGGNLGGLPPCSLTADDTALLNHLCSIEEKSATKKVRRSMRGRKDAESEGLAWIQIPADDFLGQVPLESGCKVQRRLSSSGPQESTHAVISPSGSRRRRSFCVLGAGKDQSVAFHIQRNRRASLGYKSDRCHRKTSEMKKFLKNQPTL
ncbi:cell division cycle-associated protein 2 [Candoia aspera]|uniref:cell division cycle-associated protein 2 n=1 Tax=Candoia aspera TaxID=51853 RepID=UPI002FD84DEF